MMRTKSFKIAALMLVGTALAGCVSWASYPATPGETALKDPNTPAVEEIMMAGLKWTVSKYPPVNAAGEHTGGGRLAINLPFGVKPRVYRRVAEAAGGGAEPVTTENRELPLYHVKAVRVRGDEAQINIVWPAMTLGASPSGGPVYQEVKLGLSGGLSPWHVVSFREWGPGAEPADINLYHPEPGYEPPVPKGEKKPEKPANLPPGP